MVYRVQTAVAVEDERTFSLSSKASFTHIAATLWNNLWQDFCKTEEVKETSWQALDQAGLCHHVRGEALSSWQFAGV